MDLRETLRRFDITPKKSLGQNFLFDPVILDRIVQAGDVGSNDTVLEIGPGAGSLTRALAGAAAHVIAVELDKRLLSVLEHTVGDLGNVTVVHGDILEINLPSLIPVSRYKVVANIPYYITSAVIRRLLEASNQPSLIVLTVQREVAERICAAPPDMSVLAVSVQFYGRPAIVGRIPAGAFYPAPDVDSAIVRIEPAEKPPLAGEQADRFFALVKAGFSQKRKQLKNTLASGLGLKPGEAERLLKAAGVEPTRRPQTLSLEEWLRLWSKSRVAG